jgi:hypothetical protein
MRCATAQSPIARQQAPEPVYEPEPQYEIAEIKFTVLKENFMSRTCRFFVDVVGPQGQYTYARGEDFKKRKDIQMHHMGGELGDKVTPLINKMVREGWRPSPQGPEWYSYCFHRRVK